MSRLAQTQIGCEIFIRKGDQILLGKRKNCYGAGTWALPGGHLKFNERLVDAICREIREEIGATIKPKDVQLISIVDDLQPQNDAHYVHVTFELREPEFEAKIMEPDYCEEWRYFSIHELPLNNLFAPHTGIIDNYLKQRLYLLP